MSFMLRTFSQRIEFGFSRSDLFGFKVYLSLFHQCRKKHASKVDSTVVPDMAVVKLEPADWSSSFPEGSDLLIKLQAWPEREILLVGKPPFCGLGVSQHLI